MDSIRVLGDVLFMNIKVIPGASKSEIAGEKGETLRIRIAAVPEDGKANGELRSYLAKSLGIPKKDVVIASGEKSRFKILRLPAEVLERMEGLIKIQS